MADTESDSDAAALQKMIDAGLVVAAAEPGPMPAPLWRPVALLEEFLRPLGMTQSEAARRMEIPLNRLNEVIRGRGGNGGTALRLAKLLNTDPEIWMNLQNQWNLCHAARAATRAS